MTEGIEAITTASLSIALDIAMLRHQTHATNVANIHIEGYVPKRVNFEAYVQDARRSLTERGQIDSQALASMSAGRPLALLVNSTGTAVKVQLDAEVSGMAQNMVQYQALIKGVSRHLSVLYTAASDGKK